MCIKCGTLKPTKTALTTLILHAPIIGYKFEHTFGMPIMHWAILCFSIEISKGYIHGVNQTHSIFFVFYKFSNKSTHFVPHWFSTALLIDISSWLTHLNWVNETAVETQGNYWPTYAQQIVHCILFYLVQGFYVVIE